MKIEDLKPGRYRLTKDVLNPSPDRRVSTRYTHGDWRKYTTIPADWTFIVRSGHKHSDFPEPPSLIAEGRYSSQDIQIYDATEPHALLAAMLPYLEPMEWDIHSALRAEALGEWYSPLLDQLAQMGKITLNDIKEACRREYDLPEE